MIAKAKKPGFCGEYVGANGHSPLLLNPNKKPGFLILADNPETGFLNPRRPPRNRVSYSSQLTQKPGFLFPAANQETRFLI